MYDSGKTTFLLRSGTLLALLLCLVSCEKIADKAATPPLIDNFKNESEYRLTVLHTNDHHGRFWSNGDGEYGLAARKTLVDQIRAEVTAEGGYSLLLSGGDINTGMPESDMHDAEPDFKGMSMVGYDAMAVGNHEFDNSVATIRKQESWSNFPFLSANIYADQGQRLFKPYKIFEFGESDAKDKLQVAVIGLTTEKTDIIGNQKFVEGLSFTLPERETAALMPEMQAAADIVIAVTHMGHHQYNIGSDISLARAIDDLDLIVGGHSAEPICMDESGVLIENYQRGAACVPDLVNGTLIVQAHEWGKYIGRADLLVKGDKVTLERYRLLPVNLIDTTTGGKQWLSSYIEPDRAMVELLQPFQDAGGQALGAKISHASGLFDKDDLSRLPNPSTLGTLITNALIAATNSDIALWNHGGLRDNIGSGDITLKTILQIAPFKNRIVLNQFSGTELLHYFEAIGLLPANQSRVQFSGIHFQDGELLTAAGTPIEMDKNYLLSLNDFMAAGGDGFPNLTGLPGYLDTGLLDYQVLSDYIGKLETISPDQY